MRILDRLPVVDAHDRLDVHGKALRIRPFQIIVRVSLSEIAIWDARTPIIPALLDSGNNHNYPDDGSNDPRLPLLGLRAIIKNKLKLVIDGKRNYVSLNSPAW